MRLFISKIIPEKTQKVYLGIILLFALVAVFPTVAFSQISLPKIGNDINKNLFKKTLTNEEIIQGLKEALTIGSENAAGSASKTNGYFGNPTIKIPFPPEAKKMEKELRALGMGKQVNKFILTINRAAEDAAKQAAPIFLDAIKSMTISDGINILKGSDTAATSYLREKTYASLFAKFKPIIKSATQKVEVTKHYKPLAKTYNNIPFVEKVNPDLEEYITQAALKGLFYLTAQEEMKIRKDPAARVTEILKDVFGGTK
jgi:hypothetical protein